MSTSQDLKIKTCRFAVTTAGTRQQFLNGDRASYLAHAITFRANAANTGNLYLGSDNRVSAIDYSYILAPGETITISGVELGKLINLTRIWFDADTDGNALSYCALLESEPY